MGWMFPGQILKTETSPREKKPIYYSCVSRSYTSIYISYISISLRTPSLYSLRYCRRHSRICDYPISIITQPPLPSPGLQRVAGVVGWGVRSPKLCPVCNAARPRRVYSRVAKPPSLLYIDYRGEDLSPVATILPTHHMVPYSTPRVASHIPLLPYYTLHCAINRSAPCLPVTQ